MARGTISIPTARTRPVEWRGGVWESVTVALESLRSNKLRTFLTMLGVVIGVWSVVSLLSIGAGAQKAITDRVRNIGTNLVTVLPGVRPNSNLRTDYAAIAAPLTLDDARVLGELIPEVALVAPEVQNDTQVVAGSLNRSARVLGVTPEYAVVRNVTVAGGQFLTEPMVRSARPVAVLGARLKTELFGASDPIGQSLRIKGQAFKVVGVLEAAGAFGAYDNAVLVPITAAHRSLFGGRDATSSSYQVSAISLQVRHAADVEQAQIKVEQLMRQRHRLPANGMSDDFTVFNQATLLSVFNTVTTTLTIFLGSIAGISLFVGGIGVMNILLVSVTERTKEIGLRKAVGAKRRDILRQFLVEALAISLLGGLVGVLLGYVTTAVIGLLYAEYLVPIVTPAALAVALGFSAAVGLFFGIYPAYRASRLSPIEALRYE
jgi:putative ABC transport system permease protein